MPAPSNGFVVFLLLQLDEGRQAVRLATENARL
jgi:hypothetical protein